MKIKKVLNHNSVLVTDGEGQESILMGKGIAFGYKKGDSVNTQLIDKQFGLISAGSGRNAFRSEFLEAFNGLEDDELEATLKIIAFAKTQISDIDDTIYLTLADHVHGIKLRVRKGAVNVRNPLKKRYKKNSILRNMPLASRLLNLLMKHSVFKWRMMKLRLLPSTLPMLVFSRI